MARVRITLANMGIVVQAQSQYRYRCIRPRRHPDTGSSDFSKSQDNTKNLDSDEELDVKDWEVITKTDEALDDSPLEKRETPYVTASDYSFETLPPSKTQSPQPSHLHSAASSPETSYLALVPPLPPSSAASSTSEIELLSAPEEPRAIIYGAREQDRGDEVRFSVELTRLDGLTDTYSLDIRRLRGNLRSYKYIYDEVRRRVAETKGC
ncbi:hypothetical protein H0H81_004557 [Sphagnurus paluster]|uniref:KA1 domain-containing protein n=1 Tax=Sphagnurus paluster TaxID=117069 RepID=A0A9P7FSR5_9AGAR|nr:hypothetical protein H0H81_004557 [Sphagnurus paluster]